MKTLTVKTFAVAAATSALLGLAASMAQAQDPYVISHTATADGGYYRLQEAGSPTTAANSSAVSANPAGTVTGAVTGGAPGPLQGATAGTSRDTAYTFAGGSVAIANPFKNTSSFTIEQWFNTTNSGQGGSDITLPFYLGVGLANAETGGVVNDFGVGMIGGAVLFGVGNPDLTIHSAAGLADGKWHMYDAVDNAGLQTLYVDGVQVASGGIANATNRSAPSFIYLGGENGGQNGPANGNFYSGELSETAFYTTPLTAAQVAANFAAAAPLPAVPEASSSVGLGVLLALGGLALVARKKSVKA